MQLLFLKGTHDHPLPPQRQPQLSQRSLRRLLTSRLWPRRAGRSWRNHFPACCSRYSASARKESRPRRTSLSVPLSLPLRQVRLLAPPNPLGISCLIFHQHLRPCRREREASKASPQAATQGHNYRGQAVSDGALREAEEAGQRKDTRFKTWTLAQPTKTITSHPVRFPVASPPPRKPYMLSDIPRRKEQEDVLRAICYLTGTSSADTTTSCPVPRTTCPLSFSSIPCFLS